MITLLLSVPEKVGEIQEREDGYAATFMYIEWKTPGRRQNIHSYILTISNASEGCQLQVIFDAATDSLPAAFVEVRKCSPYSEVPHACMFYAWSNVSGYIITLRLVSAQLNQYLKKA